MTNHFKVCYFSSRSILRFTRSVVRNLCWRLSNSGLEISCIISKHYQLTSVLQNMRSVQELTDISRALCLDVQDGVKCSSSDEDKFKGYNGKIACDLNTVNDGHVVCTQPHGFTSQLGATFTLRVWPGIIIEQIKLPKVGRNDPQHFFHGGFEPGVFQMVHCPLHSEAGKGALGDTFTHIGTAIVTDHLQMIFRMWCYTGRMFVHFTQFWLFESTFNCETKWLQSENLKDKLSFLFECGLDAKKRWPWDLTGIFYTFCNYPTHLLQTS